ncbi:MAG TPA: helix-turn-helix transcriptional regulator [Candidatus Saccharimonadales bacterium]|nr:helix-turn-helix transcriptional regulator [Candidatus Saccharimonadales bacterium]
MEKVHHFIVTHLLVLAAATNAGVLWKDMKEPKAPFITLGTHLKYLREQIKESLAEVAGAVEIEERLMQRIEAGEERPAEDILLLLISHFDMQDQEAVQLWELAGYDGEVPEQIQVKDQILNSKSIVMLLAVDLRTMYTDGVTIDTSPTGITLTFTQNGDKGQAAPVAKLGMSFEQAQEVIKTLYHSIQTAKLLGQPKALPPQSDCPHDSHNH